MKIESSNIKLAATHSAIRWRERRESVHTGGVREQVSLARQPAAASVNRVSAGTETRPEPTRVDPCLLEDPEWGRLMILKLIVERLTGRRLEVLNLAELAGSETEPAAERTETLDRSQFWLVYERYEAHYEAESTHFSAAGVIRTADGHEIRFDLKLSMSREFFREESTRISVGIEPAVQDPLVINFTGSAATLTTARFAFDLNGDGQLNTISFVGPGSGLLALDRNGDGVINDGTELFGPVTGDGFRELARYDVDGNGWIDAADPVYGQLRVWTRDDQGTDLLLTLGEAGVGAIYLNRVDTPFSITTPNNDLLGLVRSTGVYVGRDYSVKTVQQIDLVVT